MIRRYLSIVVFIAVISLTVQPRAQYSLFSSNLEMRLQGRMLAGVILPDSHSVFIPFGSRSLLTDKTGTNTSQPLSELYLSTQPLRFYGLKQYELSRFDCIMQGADIGMTLGLFMGALGSVAGTWDERSAWYIAGAMAAMGAFIGGTSRASDPKWRIRYHWDE